MPSATGITRIRPASALPCMGVALHIRTWQLHLHLQSGQRNQLHLNQPIFDYLTQKNPHGRSVK